MDGSLKIWNIKNFKKPLVAHYNLHTYNPGSKIAISPCDNIVITGNTEGNYNF